MPSLPRSAVLAGLGATVAAPAIGGAQPLAPLAIAGAPDDAIARARDAQHDGTFARNGLAVRIVPERSATAVTAGIAAGRYQVATSTLVGLIVARSTEIPFVLVAPGSIPPIAGLLVAAHRRFTTAAELNGASFGVAAASDLDALAAKAWMDKNGGNAATIRLVELPMHAIPAAIAGGHIDAGIVREPALQPALAGRTVRLVAHPIDAIAPRVLDTAWFALESWAEAHTTETDAFARALRTHAQPGAALDPALIQPVIDACAKYKFIEALFDAQALIVGS